MGSVKISGIETLISDFSKMANLPDHVSEAMLQAEADVVLAAQRTEIEKQWKGPYSLGISAKSVKKGRVKKGKDGPFISIYPQGSRKRGKKTIKEVRNGEIAFFNEYGAPKRNIRARPAIRTANEKSESNAVAAGEKVYNNFLDSLNL